MTTPARTRISGSAPEPVRVHRTALGAGITRTPEFGKKGLASFAVNVGTKCGHSCTYCSTGATLRRHGSFKAAGENPLGLGYAIVDPASPERVARDARRIRQRGLVELCTTSDAWSPEAQEHDLGRRCLEALVAEPGWEVRILTKNAAVARDFDVVAAHRDRIGIGISLTATPRKKGIISVIEPYASPIADRIAALRRARAMGLRVYAMLCPLLPGMSDDAATVRELVQVGLEIGAEEFFVEPVNARGRNLILTADALRQAGFADEADAVDAVRRKEAWSHYARRLLETVQAELRTVGTLGKLRYLLYPARLVPDDLAWIKAHDEGVRWLGNP